MSANTKIEWTDATPMIDRNGARTRYYKRKDMTKPGQQIRREMLANGLKWCRECRKWMSVELVGKNGLCRPHENEDARNRYANDPDFKSRRLSHSAMRKRGVGRMPSFAAELISELFDGECAYCHRPGVTWDHVIPVSKGGKTEPGNMVPACRSCNSSKHDADIDVWLDRAPMVKPFTIEYLSIAGVL